MKNLIKGFVKILEHYVWQMTFMYFAYFFFTELQQIEKEHSSLQKFWYFSPITLHKYATPSYNYYLHLTQNSQENS